MSLHTKSMSTHTPKSPKPAGQTNHFSIPSSSVSPSLSSHFADVALKQQILLSLSKLADRDTHQLALQDLQSITQSLSPNAVPLLHSSLYSFSSDPMIKAIVKRDCLHLLSLCCQIRYDLKLPRLNKIIAHIVKVLKDSDPSVRNACSDVVGVLSGLYLKGGVGEGRIELFVRPFFEAMWKQNKRVQLGATMCLAKTVKCAMAENLPVSVFQQLCPRVCKLLKRQNFHAKSVMLGVVEHLLQVWAICFFYIDFGTPVAGLV